MSQGLTFYVNPDTGQASSTPPANLSPSSRGIFMTPEQRTALMQQITSIRGSLGSAAFFANPESLSDDQLWDAYVSAVQASGSGPSEWSIVAPMLAGSLAGAGAGTVLGGSGASAPAASTTGGTTTAAASPTLLADAGTTATDVSPGLSGAQMPAPVPETDPTFGGTLTQTAPGAYENLANVSSFGSPGSPFPVESPTPSANPSNQTPPLSRILRGEGTLEDYMSLLGRAAPAVLGYLGASNQADSLSRLADQYMAIGAPSRVRYESSFAPGFTMENDPGYTDALSQSAKGTLHALSAKVGNPAGSPNAWSQTLSDLYSKTAYPALQTYRNQNASTGGYGAFNTAAPGAATGAIGAEKGMYDAIGAGAADIFNPPRTLTDILREVRRAGY